jgi:hypothetical protein
LLPGHVVIPDRPSRVLSYRIDYRGVDYRSAAADWVLELVEGIEAERIDLVVARWADTLRWPSRSLTRKGATPGPDGSTGWPLPRRNPALSAPKGNPITGPLIARIRITDPEDDGSTQGL